MTRAMIYAAAAAPGCIAVALIQNMFYGSPWRSGYGSLDGLFALDHIIPNAMRYGAWMSQTHTPAWLIALASPFLLAGSLPMLLLMLGAVNVLCYLPYAVFNDWWYLRFMLPAIALVLVLLAVTVDAIAARLIARRPAALLAILAMALSLVLVREAEARNVFDLRRLEARYQRAGMYVGSRLPPNALVITSWESGSVRYYGKRTTLVWDALDAAWLDRALAYSRTRGLEPYLLFERWEEPLFRQRFAASPLAALDWPPSAEIASQVRVFRPDDQERYRRGEAAPTDYAR